MGGYITTPALLPSPPALPSTPYGPSLASPAPAKPCPCPGLGVPSRAYLAAGSGTGVLLTPHNWALGVPGQAGARVAGSDRWEGCTDLQWMSGGDTEDSGGGPGARTPPCSWKGWEKGRPIERGLFLLQRELRLRPLAEHRPGQRQDPRPAGGAGRAWSHPNTLARRKCLGHPKPSSQRRPAIPPGAPQTGLPLCPPRPCPHVALNGPEPPRLSTLLLEDAGGAGRVQRRGGGPMWVS